MGERGDKLTLCDERDNPHDPEAAGIYYGNTKLGYVPGNEVGPLSLMMYYGHEVFKAQKEVSSRAQPASGGKGSARWMLASRQWRLPCLMTMTCLIWQMIRLSGMCYSMTMS
ncbi:MAG: hypothetical protein ACLU0O_03185 [Collinsella sp.]